MRAATLVAVLVVIALASISAVPASLSNNHHGSITTTTTTTLFGSQSNTLSVQQLHPALAAAAGPVLFASAQEEDSFGDEEDEVVATDDDGDDEEVEVVVPAKSAKSKTTTATTTTTTTTGDDDEEAVEQEVETAPAGESDAEAKPRKAKKAPKVAPVPRVQKVRGLPEFTFSNWYPELFSLLGMVVYVLNYFTGRSKNTTLATAWARENGAILQKNFAQTTDPESRAMLYPENASMFYNWSTGRVNCAGMLTTLDFLRRPDLLSMVFATTLQPATDKITYAVEMNNDAMDTFVVAFGPKAKLTKLRSEMHDLSFFTTGYSGESYGLPASFAVHTDCPEVARELITPELAERIRANPKTFDVFHFSDKFQGTIDNEVPADQRPTPRPMLFMTFNLSKQRADKKRAQMQDELNKIAHQKLQEAAQLKREEKLRLERQQAMNSSDPDARAKWEEKQRKDEMKKRMAKGKIAVMR
ncbi:hypothetical protein CAOG_002263 [Capsaspora owczarzaki ATCC 30864]|uniref:Coiled-coil domain-containing protein 47 n=1 Tax=Capsaspora owczarzaki (strain ATCC 30864) TaxID=595528 RepID=A0A0D2U7I3_CAPO3|nr:hypothetical protein CAOG_002263 [Capsaspora owczarzaki ATCC 30864]